MNDFSIKKPRFEIGFNTPNHGVDAKRPYPCAGQVHENLTLSVGCMVKPLELHRWRLWEVFIFWLGIGRERIRLIADNPSHKRAVLLDHNHADPRGTANPTDKSRLDWI
jgi:hypothetical protein